MTVEIDTSLTGTRLIRVFERLRAERGLPNVLRTDNGPEFLNSEFVTWAESNGMTIQYIQPGEPNKTHILNDLTAHTEKNCFHFTYSIASVKSEKQHTGGGTITTN